MKASLKGQVVWLTGASSGIGAALVPLLQTECEHVFISARNAESLCNLATGYRNVTALVADVTQPDSLKTATTMINSRYDHLDCLIANAGTCEYVDVGHFDSALIERVMRTNFMGLVYSVEAALPLLRKSARPRIAGVSSSVTALAMPCAEAYGASKAASTHFLQSLRADLWAEGIEVSVISPGFVQTPLTDKNDFPMPARISAEQAATAIVRGLNKGASDIHFPKRFTRLLRFIGWLPDFLRFRITRAMARPAPSAHTSSANTCGDSRS